MQRKLFHNRHDKASRDALEALDADVEVIDVYGSEYPNFGRDILDQYQINRFPYLIDREVILLSETEQPPGTFVLDFEIRDWQGQLVTDSVDVFVYVSVGGVQRMESIATSTGTFSLEMTCSTAQEIGLRITDYNSDDGIDIFEATVLVLDY